MRYFFVIGELMCCYVYSMTAGRNNPTSHQAKNQGKYILYVAIISSNPTQTSHRRLKMHAFL